MREGLRFGKVALQENLQGHQLPITGFTFVGNFSWEMGRSHPLKIDGSSVFNRGWKPRLQELPPSPDLAGANAAIIIAHTLNQCELDSVCAKNHIVAEGFVIRYPASGLKKNRAPC